MSSLRLSSQSSVPLTYTIAECSEPSGRYVAENILEDRPADQSSRWSGAHQGKKQWILLRLDALSVVTSITFGKFHKPHPCNTKEFKLYIGMNDTNMTEVLHSSLKNDSIPETFSVRHVNNAGLCIPTRFIKVVPLSAHGQSFHTSIWHVAMTGITDETFVEQQVRVPYEEYRETTILRHILKHLRQRRLLTPYQAILNRTGLQVEHPLITELYESIVLQGNWPKSEQLLHQASQAGIFDAYLRSCQPHAIWTRLNGVDADGDAPSRRGGHAMCIDHANGIIYLFGGWDGQKSLDDFWAYNIKEDKWRVLSHGTSSEKNGPGARSCHKMVFDSKTGSIYLLGRLSDADALKPKGETSVTDSEQTPGQSSGNAVRERSTPTTTAFCSEFYRYHARGLDGGKWDLLQFDTAAAGGPPLIFDHQMVMDCDAQIVYVFGGRVVDGDWDTIKYSGLYSYNVRMSKWRMLQPVDSLHPSQVTIPSRFGHSMVFEPTARMLYIFAGQRDDKYLSDMYTYDIATNTATEIYTNFTASGGPDPCFTQRAVIDPQLREIYVFCGLTRSQHLGSCTVLPADSPNWVYRYDMRPGKWTQILSEPEGGTTHPGNDTGLGSKEPLPRYAHQVVYDPNTKTVFMHGGNAGLVGSPEREGRNSLDGDGQDKEGEAGMADGEGQEGAKEKRLDDFWRMNLMRPVPDEIIRRGKYMIRRQQFRELCEGHAPVKALNFLQTEVSSVVNHADPEETDIFRSLLTHLLTLPPTSPQRPPPHTGSSDNTITPRNWRPDSPVDSWTNSLDEDEVMADGSPVVSAPVHVISAQSLRSLEDVEERKVREDESENALSADRFAQRNEVFESLLEFASKDSKQPDGSLLDMVDGDEGGL